MHKTKSFSKCRSNVLKHVEEKVVNWKTIHWATNNPCSQGGGVGGYDFLKAYKTATKLATLAVGAFWRNAR